MSHIINLNNMEIEISISKEEYEPNYEYINETIDYFMTDNLAISGTFSYEDVNDTKEIKTLIPVSWEIKKGENIVFDEMISKIDEMIEFLSDKANTTDDFKLSSKVSRVIDGGMRFKELLQDLKENDIKEEN